MPLNQEELKALLAVKPKTRGQGSKKYTPATRDVETWFKLEHLLVDEETKDVPVCDNPNCLDPRPRIVDRGQVVVQLGTAEYSKRMCRYCFLDGWLMETSAQQTSLLPPTAPR